MGFQSLRHSKIHYSLELFAGAGGLSLGLASNGICHRALIDLNKNACATLGRNIAFFSNGKHIPEIIEGDANKIDYKKYTNKVDILAGGPPCQPFSLGGKHAGMQDTRDMWPVTIRAVREIRPRAFIFENVKGLTREKFSSYLNYIILQLTYPDFLLKKNENWNDHRTRLERYHLRKGKTRPEYRIVYRLLNAADYGIPQKRERVFVVGFRDDCCAGWSFPNPTHSLKQLIHEKWISGDYWAKHSIKPSCERPVNIEGCTDDLFLQNSKPWVTVRDAIGDLFDEGRMISNQRKKSGAKSYPGHTGSSLDDPAKTLKAGVHGVPGGENMLIDDYGNIRYFTTREAARLQTFPDDFHFIGSWTESMRQLGNAVPVNLATLLTRSIVEKLDG